MKKNITPIFIAALLAITALCTVWHLSTRTPDTANALTVTCGHRQIVLHADSMNFTDIHGEIRNAKGETKAIDAKGISLPELLALAEAEDCKGITAVAADTYTAQLTHGEFDRVFIIVQPEDGFQMVVFDDPDSRRNLRNLTEVITE